MSASFRRFDFHARLFKTAYDFSLYITLNAGGSWVSLGFKLDNISVLSGRDVPQPASQCTTMHAGSLKGGSLHNDPIVSTPGIMMASTAYFICLHS